MSIKQKFIDIIADLNSDSVENIEYKRGQIELAIYFMGYEDDGYHEKQELAAAVEQAIARIQQST